MTIKFDEFLDCFRDRPTVSEADIFEYFRRQDPELKLATLRWRLFDLRRRGKISRLARGIYSLTQLKEFQPDVSAVLKRAYRQIKRELPYAELCIWSTAWIDSLIVHQPTSKIIIAETEKIAVSKAFSLLNGHARASFLDPTEKEIEFYVLPNRESIVVKPLVLRAPLIHLDGIVAPRLEKILVDVFADRELFAALQGETLHELFRNALSQFHVDLTTLESYASRRGKRQELREFLTTDTRLPDFTQVALKGLL